MPDKETVVEKTTIKEIHDKPVDLSKIISLLDRNNASTEALKTTMESSINELKNDINNVKDLISILKSDISSIISTSITNTTAEIQTVITSVDLIKPEINSINNLLLAQMNEVKDAINNYKAPETVSNNIDFSPVTNELSQLSSKVTSVIEQKISTLTASINGMMSSLKISSPTDFYSLIESLLSSTVSKIEEIGNKTAEIKQDTQDIKEIL